MVSFTAFVSAITMGLLTSTALSAPWPPPSSSLFDVSLYKTSRTPPVEGNELLCWDPAPGVNGIHTAPTDIGICHKADFYALSIDSDHSSYPPGGYGCSISVWENDGCNLGAAGIYSTQNVCYTPSTIGDILHLQSYRVDCTNPPSP